MKEKHIYEKKSIERLKVDFSRRRSSGLNSFVDFEEFYNWYIAEEKTCHYCGIKEEETQEIVMTGLLKSNRFPQNGILGRGQSRGVWLEVDRLKPKENYSKTNCVLACYFCNNDKSDVFHSDDYKEFLKDRPAYLRSILKNRGK